MQHLRLLAALHTAQVRWCNGFPNHSSSGSKSTATTVIAQLAGCEEAGDAFGEVAGVRVLVDLVNSSISGRVKENAVSGLLNLVRCGRKGVGDYVKEMVLMSKPIIDALSSLFSSSSSFNGGGSEELPSITGGEDLSRYIPDQGPQFRF
ncbi:hypothetical protein L1987_60025 [Smallanthus sonchifolius]|uniref:Uncharacterized protein n=1 Tax=Smallanthus sonchifolius TaxID=185202 RepID=A0ACB9D753_9ASTR|nr:hypothetical protein L1987_60025 [Smallanthus sonchifolius]